MGLLWKLLFLCVGLVLVAGWIMGSIFVALWASSFAWWGFIPAIVLVFLPIMIKMAYDMSQDEP